MKEWTDVCIHQWGVGWKQTSTITCKNTWRIHGPDPEDFPYEKALGYCLGSAVKYNVQRKEVSRKYYSWVDILPLWPLPHIPSWTCSFQVMKTSLPQQEQQDSSKNKDGPSSMTMTPNILLGQQRSGLRWWSGQCLISTQQKACWVTAKKPEAYILYFL